MASGSRGEMGQDLDELVERIARAVATMRRQATQATYELDWSPMLPYTDEYLEEADAIGSCVYEIWQRSSGGRIARYVGETRALGSRLRQHTYDSEENVLLKQAIATHRDALYFSYASVRGPAARKSAERALWKLYQYAWNDEDGPKGAGLEGRVIVDETFPGPYVINFNGVRKPVEGVKSPVDLP